MNNTTLTIGGQVVFWTLSNHTDFQKLSRHLQQLGFEGCLPEPRTKFAALRDALTANYGAPDMLIRPLDGRMGCTVVQEIKGEVENDYIKVVSIAVKDIEEDPYRLNPSVVESYKKNLSLLHSQSMALVMVKIVEQMHGTCLRPSGGVYWLAKRHADRWLQLAQAVEECGKGNSVFSMAVQDDPQMIRAVVAGLTAEIDLVTGSVEAAVESGTLGERGLTSQGKRAEAAAAKLAEYETTLGVELANVRQRIEAAQASAFKAALMASAQEEIEANQK